MSEGSSLPNTENFAVAQLAVALEIAKMAMNTGAKIYDREQYADLFIKIYTKAWDSITGNK